MRRPASILALTASLAVAAFVAAGRYVRTASPDREGERPVPGLEEPVEVWRDSLGRLTAARLYSPGEGGSDAVAGWFPAEAVDDLIERRTPPWVDDDAGARAGFDSPATEAMRAAVARVGDRSRGRLHRIAARHTFADAGRVGAVLDRVFHVDVGPVPGVGSRTTVSVSYDRELPTVASYGPSLRHVVDMADIDGTGGFVIPTGQSGLPFEDGYRDQWARYREGRLWLIPLDRERARRRVVQRMVLQPTTEGT